MTTPTLSAIVITRDEAANIEACLASVAFADERVVVDSASGDATREIAARLGATVVDTGLDWPGFGPQKQRALDRATGRWVLSIDADERVTPELAASIVAVVSDADDGGPDAWEVSRLSRFDGRWIRHGDWHPDRVVRLFRRGRARFSDDRVHERLVVDPPGAIGRLEGDLLHDTMPTFEHALAKLNRYSSEGAAQKVAAGDRGGAAAAFTHATWAFLRSYIVKRGFLDGRAGFLVALYVAEGTWWRYLKMAELARRLPTEARAER